MSGDEMTKDEAMWRDEMMRSKLQWLRDARDRVRAENASLAATVDALRQENASLVEKINNRANLDTAWMEHIAFMQMAADRQNDALECIAAHLKSIANKHGTDF